MSRERMVPAAAAAAAALAEAGPAMAQPMTSGGACPMWEHWYGMMLGPLLMLVLFAGAVALAVLIVRRLGGDRSATSRTQKTALDILEERFARGEIDKNEFEERRTVLER